MLFFKCRMSSEDLALIERRLPRDLYWISREHFEDFHYGVIKSVIFNKLLNILSGETLEQLEYLSEHEFKAVLDQLKNKRFQFAGNPNLLMQ